MDLELPFPGTILINILPTNPSEPIVATASSLICSSILLAIIMWTLIVVSLNISISFTVPTFIPEKRTLFPFWSPFAFLKRALTSKVFPNIFCLFPIKYAATSRSIVPSTTKIPNFRFSNFDFAMVLFFKECFYIWVCIRRQFSVGAFCIINSVY